MRSFWGIGVGWVTSQPLSRFSAFRVVDNFILCGISFGPRQLATGECANMLFFPSKKCSFLGKCFIIMPFVMFNSEYRMSEAPFRPREQLVEKQKYFQSIHKHTYLKGPFDKVTSVAIPAALAATSLFLIGRGIYNMSHGIGKKE